MPMSTLQDRIGDIVNLYTPEIPADGDNSSTIVASEVHAYTIMNNGCIVDFTDEKKSVRKDILDKAASCVLKYRAATHGDLEDSFAHTANLWGAHLGVKITSTDVAVMMALLKVARIKSTPAHKDNWVDLAGYAACGGELALRDQD